ncbi:MAG: histidinol-phosphate transaminase [Leptolyngbya sp. SIO4C1]|nr:histidinol-phosphate transaminase [Leptolyngbya sp. SIO4C1]
MLPFLRDDLAQLSAYTPHAGQAEKAVVFDQLDTNESPFDLPDFLKAALAEQYQQAVEANRYPDGGHLRLKEAIAGYAAESAQLSEVASDCVSVGNGSDELIRSLLIATCLGGSGAILTAAPTFSMYGILAKTLGIPVMTIDRSDATFALDLEAASAAVADSHPPIRVVFMVHPNSPTANALTEAELTWLRSLPETVLVVVDEAYFEFCQQTTVADALQRSNWVVLRTFSKAFRLAAHRVGYAVAQPALIAALEKVRLPYNLPSFSQAAALSALANRTALLEAIPSLLQAREQLSQALAADSRWQVWPSQANFIYVRLSPAGLDRLGLEDQTAGLVQIFQKLRSRGTLIRQTGGGLRITIGTAEQNQRTQQNLAAVLDELSLAATGSR